MSSCSKSTMSWSATLTLRLMAGIVFLIALTGCGQKGPLYIETPDEKASESVNRVEPTSDEDENEGPG